MLINCSCLLMTTFSICTGGITLLEYSRLGSTTTTPFIEQNISAPSAVFQAVGWSPTLQARVFIPSRTP